MDIEEIVSNLFRNQLFKSKLQQSYKNMSIDTKLIKKQDKKSQRVPLQQIQKQKFNQIDKFNAQPRCSITSSVFSKRQSIDSLNSMNSSPILHQIIDKSTEISLDRIISEIGTILMQLTVRQNENIQQAVNHSQKSSDFSELIEKMTDLQNQNLKNLEMKMNEAMAQAQQKLGDKIEEIIKKMQLQRKQKKLSQKSSVLKKQRKNVTKSILDMSKSSRQTGQFGNFSDLNQLGNILSDSQQEDSSNLSSRISPEISQLSQKMYATQKQFKKLSKEFQIKFQKQIDHNNKDIQMLTDKIIEWKLKNQQKIENGFGGVWNIVTDIQDKINKVSFKVDQIQQQIIGKK